MTTVFLLWSGKSWAQPNDHSAVFYGCVWQTCSSLRLLLLILQKALAYQGKCVPICSVSFQVATSAGTGDVSRDLSQPTF